MCPLILQIKRNENEKKRNNDLAVLPSHDTEAGVHEYLSGVPLYPDY